VSLERWWAGWRSDYIGKAFASGGEVDREPDDGLSLFERILHSGEPDETTYILTRGELTFALLNAYPYNSGHLMVLPNRAVPDLGSLTDDEASELWATVHDAVAAITSAYEPEGVNVGANLGKGAGAGVPDHLHVHCLPRWGGDTNFMTSIAETRVLPEALGVTWRRLRDAWPDR
jgi:ATP adenylyltransferase